MTMCDYNEEQIRLMATGAETLDDLIRDYFWRRFDADPDWDYFIDRPNLDNISVEGDTVEVDASCRACRRGCCGTDYHTYEFPLSYLWLDQTAILADMKVKAEEAAKAAAERKKQEAEERKRRQEAAERKKLAELKGKYEAQA